MTQAEQAKVILERNRWIIEMRAAGYSQEHAEKMVNLCIPTPAQERMAKARAARKANGGKVNGGIVE